MHRRKKYFVYPPGYDFNFSFHKIVLCHSRFQAKKQAKRYEYCPNVKSEIMQCTYYYDGPRQMWMGTNARMIY